MSGPVRQFGIIIALTLLAAATVLFSNVPARAGTCYQGAPPTDYWRKIAFRTVDLAGRPLSGVAVQMDVKWGDLGFQRCFVTQDDGMIVIPVKPVSENTTEGKQIRDRFMSYRLWLNYRLEKPGYVPFQGCLKDNQEYACFTDPLYQGLNKIPDDKPLVIPVTLHAYCDYLDCPPEPDRTPKADAPQAGSKKTNTKKPGPKVSPETARCHELVYPLKVLVGKLVAAAPERYSPQPGSITCLPGNGLKIGLDFNLMFDPSQMGLQAAAKVLLKDTVSRVAAMINETFGPGYFAFYQIDVQAGFQYEKSPHDIPAMRTITFKIPATAAVCLTGCHPDGPFPCDDIEIKAGQIPILLGE